MCIKQVQNSRNLFPDSIRFLEDGKSANPSPHSRHTLSAPLQVCLAGSLSPPSPAFVGKGRWRGRAPPPHNFVPSSPPPLEAKEEEVGKHRSPFRRLKEVCAAPPPPPSFQDQFPVSGRRGKAEREVKKPLRVAKHFRFSLPFLLCLKLDEALP